MSRVKSEISISKLKEYTRGYYPKLSFLNLWKSYWVGRSNKDGGAPRNELMQNYLYIAVDTAKKFHARLPSYFRLDEIISDAYVGLMDAIRLFNPEKAKFETYCNNRIKGQILDSIRDENFLPRLVSVRKRLVEKAKRNLKSRLGRAPDPEEIIGELAKNEYKDSTSYLPKKLNSEQKTKKAKRILKEVGATHKIVSLDSLFERYGEENNSYDIEAKNSPGPSERFRRKELLEVLGKTFGRREQLILVLFYYEEMKMEDIGRVLDLNQSTISRLHSSIINILKGRLSNQELKLTPEDFYVGV